MSPALGYRVTMASGLAGLLAACGGGSGSAPDIQSNPQDPGQSTFEAAATNEAAGNSNVDSTTCVPCDIQYRCEGTFLGQSVQNGEALVNLACGQDVTIPGVTISTSAPALVDAVDGGQQTRQDEQQGVSVAFRCGGAVEVAGGHVGNWGKSQDGVLSVCIGALGSGNCLTCYPSGTLTQGQNQSGTPVSTGPISPIDAGTR